MRERGATRDAGPGLLVVLASRSRSGPSAQRAREVISVLLICSTPARTRGGKAAPGAGTVGPLEPPMSMYAELLHAAVGQRAPVELRPTRHSALNRGSGVAADSLTRARRLRRTPMRSPSVLAREDRL